MNGGSSGRDSGRALLINVLFFPRGRLNRQVFVLVLCAPAQCPGVGQGPASAQRLFHFERIEGRKKEAENILKGEILY